MAGILKIEDLVNKDLKGFLIVEMTEVYFTDYDGRRVHSLGFFKDSNIAKAFAGVQTDANYHATRRDLVLTDGTVGFVIENREPVKLFNDEVEALEIRKKVLAKLSPEEQYFLGIGE